MLERDKRRDHHMTNLAPNTQQVPKETQQQRVQVDTLNGPVAINSPSAHKPVLTK